MQIIVVGCGKVGRELIAQLSGENNNVTAVDLKAEDVKQVSTIYDCRGVIGNGTSFQTLSEAGLDQADILIAVTHSDEINLLCCVMARKAVNCRTIARVRNPVYSTERTYIQEELGLSMIINPELAAAREAARLLRFPSAIEIDTFAKGRIELLRFKVPEDSILVNHSLRESAQSLHQGLLVCVAERNGEVTIPDGNFVVQAGDTLSVVTSLGHAGKLFSKIGLRINRVKNTMIVGGGDMSYYLAQLLLASGVKVKLVEQKKERCEELSDLLPHATIIWGDGSDQELLDEEHIEQMDSLVACTGIDEENIILSLYAREKVRSKVVTKLTHVEFDGVIRNLNLDSIIYPKNITAEIILQYVRAMGNTVGNSVETLYRLMDGRVEALGFQIRAGSKMIGPRLQEMKLKKNILLAGIAREGHLIVPRGSDVVLEGDSIIVVTTERGYRDIDDILAE